MNKILKRINLIFATVLIITGCSYEPIFKQKNYNFEINEISFFGEKDTNKIIKNRLNLIKKSNDKIKRKFNISIETKKNKKVISKNTQGDPLKFELVLTGNYIVQENNNVLIDRKITKQYTYDNNSDKFKLEQSEAIILENLAEQISNIIISSIINLNDS